MSNRNYLAPTINPRNNAVLKGNVLITGTLNVLEDTTLQGNLTVNENTILGQNLTVTSETTTDELIVNTSAQLPTDTLVGVSSPNLMTFGGTIPSIKAGSGLAYFVTPRAGTIIGIAACTQASITVGNAILTPSISGTLIANGAITLPLAGTAPGDPAYSTPTGANIVALNDIVSVAISGTNDTETAAHMIFTLQYA